MLLLIGYILKIFLFPIIFKELLNIKPDNIIGKNTVNSIQSGLVFGYIGMVDFIIERMIHEIGCDEKEIKVVAIGWFSTLISSESKYIKVIDKMLTLDGLQIVYERNKSK